MEITLASYKGEDNGFDIFQPFDSLIRLVTKKKHSHNELIINGVSYSSLALKGAVQRVRYYDNSQWDFVQIDPSKIDVLHMGEVLEESKSAGYDWLGIARFIYNKIKQSLTRYFCTERCADALGIPNPHLYSPGELHEYCYKNLRLV